MANLGSLTESAITSMITQHAKNVQQDLKAVTSKGIGKFALQPKQLLDLGYIKPGLIDTRTTTEAALDILKDPAAFIGKEGVNSLDDILNNEKLQMTLSTKNLEKTFNTLVNNGLLTGKEAIEDLGTVLGGGLAGTAEDVKKWVTGEADASIGAAMELAGKASEFATKLADGPGKEVIASVVESSGITKTVKAVAGMTDTSALTKAADGLINNAKAVPMDYLSNKVKESIGI